MLLSVVLLGASPAPRRAAVDRGAPQPRDRTYPVARVFRQLSRCTASLSEAQRWHLAGIIHHESHRQGYDPLFVLALIQIESGCSFTVRGPGGGVGLTQIVPSTARAVARDVAVPWSGSHSLTTPALNIKLGVEYLAQLEENFNDPLVAMAAYNMGPGRVSRMSRQRARGARYVRKILTRYEQLLASDRRGLA